MQLGPSLQECMSARPDFACCCSFRAPIWLCRSFLPYARITQPVLIAWPCLGFMNSATTRPHALLLIVLSPLWAKEPSITPRCHNFLHNLGPFFGSAKVHFRMPIRRMPLLMLGPVSGFTEAPSHMLRRPTQQSVLRV